MSNPRIFHGTDAGNPTPVGLDRQGLWYCKDARALAPCRCLRQMSLPTHWKSSRKLLRSSGSLAYFDEVVPHVQPAAFQAAPIFTSTIVKVPVWVSGFPFCTAVKIVGTTM